ncbi:MAG TPA: glycine cleavage T C-terminal barrel domain-containing protein [Blastocatellia bacterium]|nr:glycine cleavage T C-terminal barrel domain-containing protein [Blastocatellia bacterium]
MNETLPRDYGDLRGEYDAIRGGVAVLDLSDAGKLQISGKNSVQFLNGVISNDVKSLKLHEGVLAAFPTIQGKLLALCRVYNLGEYLLLELDAINREKIFKNLSRFVPAGEFIVTDVSDQFALYSLQGPRTMELIEALTSQPIDERQYKIGEWQIAGARVFIASHSRCGETGFDIFVPTEFSQKVLETILERGVIFGARRAGSGAFEIARIEAGVPREGVDAGEYYIILESELEAAVSYTKGCYLGQEIIARIHWRGEPAKRLRGLLTDADQPPQPGAELFDGEGKKVGEITSIARSFALDRFIALGYVHRYHLTPGTKFTLKQGGAEIGRAELVELPFIKK